MNRPEPVERLSSWLETARLGHEVVFGMHRSVSVDRPDPGSLDLVAESAQIAIDRIPATLAGALELRARWSEQSVLAPDAAERTLDELRAILEEVEPAVRALLGRQVEIARELRSLLEEGAG